MYSNQIELRISYWDSNLIYIHVYSIPVNYHILSLLYFSTNSNITMAHITDDNPFESKSITRYFNGKSVFITGGTGFIGKVVVEKLLRTCPDLKNIYFMIRPKKGQTCEERIDKIFSLPVSNIMQCLIIIIYNNIEILVAISQNHNCAASSTNSILLVR